MSVYASVLGFFHLAKCFWVSSVAHPPSLLPYRSPPGEETTPLDCWWAFKQFPVSGHKMPWWTILCMWLGAQVLAFLLEWNGLLQVGEWTCVCESIRPGSQSGWTHVIPIRRKEFSHCSYLPISPAVVSLSFQLLAPRLFPELPKRKFLPEKCRLLPTVIFQ